MDDAILMTKTNFTTGMVPSNNVNILLSTSSAFIIDSVFEKFVYHKNQLEKKDGTSYVKRFENVEKRHPPYFHRVFVQNRDERTPVSIMYPVIYSM
jgi:hypothetical protein